MCVCVCVMCTCVGGAGFLCVRMFVCVCVCACSWVCMFSIWINKAWWTLSLPQTSRANPAQCYSTHPEKCACSWVCVFACMCVCACVCVLAEANEGSYVWFISVVWLVHQRDMTHLYVWHDVFVWEMCLTHQPGMTQISVWYDLLLCVARLFDSFVYTCVKWVIYMYNMAHASL